MAYEEFKSSGDFDFVSHYKEGMKFKHLVHDAFKFDVNFTEV